MYIFLFRTPWIVMSMRVVFMNYPFDIVSKDTLFWLRPSNSKTNNVDQ